MYRSIRYIIPGFLLQLLLFNGYISFAQQPVAPNAGKSSKIIQFVFTSDVHFGLTKDKFRKKKKVSSLQVNAAMISQMNKLPGTMFPNDGGVNANKRISSINAVVITGDIANREETGIQSATASWNQFKTDYFNLLHLKTPSGKPTSLLLTPGNHDVSNTVGYRRPMKPLTDAASMIGMYNLEMHPVVKRNSDNYNYQTDKIRYSLDMGSVHFVFINLWPDSAERSWITKDLAAISDTTPVLLFTHSMPDVEARFFINPNGKHNVNDTDKFENLVSEVFKDSNAVTDSALIEQRSFAQFLLAHPNIKAYFHGHNNYTEFYDWRGPDKNLMLHCFRADSPMKGKYSVTDETKLSFLVVTIDTATRKLTARECLWNGSPSNPKNPLSWGNSVSISLQ